MTLQSLPTSLWRGDQGLHACVLGHTALDPRFVCVSWGMCLPSLSPLCPHAPGAHGQQLAAGPRRQDRRPRAERGLCGPRLVALLHRPAGTQAAFVGPPPSGARCQVGVREPQGPKVMQCPGRCERGSGQDPPAPTVRLLGGHVGSPGSCPSACVVCSPTCRAGLSHCWCLLSVGMPPSGQCISEPPQPPKAAFSGPALTPAWPGQGIRFWSGGSTRTHGAWTRSLPRSWPRLGG